MTEVQIPTGLELAPDEVVLWYDRRSWKSLLGWFLLAALFIIISLIASSESGTLGMLIFILGAVFILIPILLRYSSEYTITNKRVYSRYGLISRKTSETTFDKITDMSLSQGIFGRLLNYGDLRINTAGSMFYEIVFKGVDDPKHIHTKVRSITDKHRKLERIKERIERLEDMYLLGQITKEQFEEAKRKLEESIK